MDEVPHVLAEALVEARGQAGDQGAEEHRSKDDFIWMEPATKKKLVAFVLQGAVE